MDWEQRFRSAAMMLDGSDVDLRLLTAFNANIDMVYQASELGRDLTTADPVDHDRVTDMEALDELLAYCIAEGESKEIEKDGIGTLPGGEQYIGGQAGIMASFLDGIGVDTVFYTPELSGRLAGLLPDGIVAPVMEDSDLRLGPVDAAVNTDETKENLIFEFSRETTGRLILSDTLPDYRPCFDPGLEPVLSDLGAGLDAVLVSGFQHEDDRAVLERAASQLEEVDGFRHLEYVYTRPERTAAMAATLFDHVDSIGCDDEELLQLAALVDVQAEEADPRTIYRVGRALLEEYGLSRIHIHTYGLHLLVADAQDRDPSVLRDAMLFGEMAAITSADVGHIPSLDEIRGLKLDAMHVEGTEELEELAAFLGADGIAEDGHAVVDGLVVAAIPIMVHEQPRRLVGMGDLISSGTLVAELTAQPQ